MSSLQKYEKKRGLRFASCFTQRNIERRPSLVAAVKDLIASKNSIRGINRLSSKWEAVIEIDGEYHLKMFLLNVVIVIIMH